MAVNTNLTVFDLDNYTDFKTSMYIEASAGTGKTYNITGMVKKFVDSGIPLEKILIVTYTEKAVGELRNRIREKCPEEDVDNANIFTIHSFCQKTLSEFSFSANQCSNLSLVSDDELGDFIDRWIRDSMPASIKLQFQDLFKTQTNKEDFINTLKKDLSTAINKYYLNNSFQADSAIVSLNDVYYHRPQIQRDFTYDECSEILKKAETDYDSVRTEYTWIFSGAGTQSNTKKVADFKKARLTFSCLKSLYTMWQEEKAKNKSQSYNDMIRSVREAVYQPTSILKKKLQEKYQYAIIDEFQDTNQIQWDIFKNVFMEDADHTIIVVGDPKQSIYAFQGADVNVYQSAVNAIKKIGKGYRLSTNFRSTDEMVKACNLIFKEKKDSDSKTDIVFFDASEVNLNPEYQIEFRDSDPSHTKESAKFWGESKEVADWVLTKPVWAVGNPEKPTNEGYFARVVAETIIDCCSFVNDKTKLQVFKKDKDGNCKTLRNVSFRDFTVLARTSTEMEAFENEFQKVGIPFLRYKDKNLFAGLECKHWISLFNAIGADDFTGSKRGILSEALFTSFFGIPLDQVQDEKYDNPYNPERQKIIAWQTLAQQRRWANLLQRIFSDSDIENRLSHLDKIPSLSKFRQIGNYAVEYLYKNECSVEEVSRHLARLAASIKGAEEGDNLVAKGTDFDCVQLMSIHASKGLEFPVVIAAGGFKQKYSKNAKVYSYHDKKGHSYLGFGDPAKKQMDKELDYEWQRLFYVAYTRASSLIILPYYAKWTEYRPYLFLKNNIAQLFKQGSNFIKELKLSENNLSNQTLQTKVQVILAKNDEINKSLLNSSEAENTLTMEEQIEEQKECTAALSKEVPSHILYKHSYISLSKKGKKDSSEMTENGGRADKDGSRSEDKERESTAAFDSSENPVLYNTAASTFITEAPAKYPKGTKIGIALHEVFEKADFVKHGNLTSAAEAETNKEIKQLIVNCLKKQTILIPENDPEKWLSYTSSLLWKTLNAKLPEITGSTQTGNYFSLKEIDAEHRISEAEYNMNADSNDTAEETVLKNYCNGFIDLVFMRPINGKEVYSILDWKSNTFTKEGYSDYASLKKETDTDYSIQRVLYSYSLIRWLRIFYKDESEAEIFENHFGGIYYVYIRGCTPASSSGIYARTWKNWDELEKAYKKIFKELITKKQ